MEYILLMMKMTSKQPEFKAIIKAILTHNNFEKESATKTRHGDLKHL